jgi:hypothetical protein
VGRELMTAVEDILFIRCFNCGKEEYPLDKALGMSARRLVTLRLRKRSLWLATEMAYDRASLGMSKLCGISISDETIKTEGTEVIKQKEEERKKVWEEGEDIAAGRGKERVFVQVDGIGYK